MTLLLIVSACAALARGANADLTTSNANEGRGPFVKCGDAIDVMSQSDNGREKAVFACNAALKYYAKRADAAKSEDDVCLSYLYLASSAKRYGYVLSTSLNQSASRKMYANADKILDFVISHCPDEPNIVRAAKAIRHVSGG